MDTATRRALEGKVARRVLDADDLRIFEAVRRGKTMSALAQMYRKYEGENDVREAYERAQAKVHAAINSRVDERAVERPLDEHLLPDEDDDHGGIPIRSVPAGTMGGGARPASSPAATPPKAGRQPSPAPERLPAVRDSPAPATPHPRRAASDGALGPTSQLIYDFVREHGPCTSADIVSGLGVKQHSMGDVTQRLEHRGLIERAGKQGSRAILWRAVESTEPPPRAELAVREPVPTPPPPFAGHASHLPRASNLAELSGLQLRYMELLLAYLEGASGGEEPTPEALMDRIERLLGLNGRPEQAQVTAGDGELH